MMATVAHTDLLILPDGRVLAHNLTPAMARALAELDPRDRAMKRRARGRRKRPVAETSLSHRNV